MTEHNAEEIGLHIHRQREALGYGRERLAGLSETFNFFLSDIERGDRGSSVALLGKLFRVLKLSVDYILFGAKQATDISDTTDTLSGLGGKYILKLKELLGAYLKMITPAEKQNHQCKKLLPHEQFFV